MFIRPPLPQPLANSSAKFALVVRAGANARIIEIGGRAVTALILLGCLLIAWFIAAASYVAFRDDVIRAVASSERRSVQVYEDRIADLRQRIDRMTARQVANQDTIEDRVAGLVARQAELEARQIMVADVSTRARDSGFGGHVETDVTAATTGATLPTSFLAQPAGRGRPTPLDGIPALPFAAQGGGDAEIKRQPETRLPELRAPDIRGFEQLKMRGAIQGVVDEVERRTERMERSQINLLMKVAHEAEITAIRDRRVIAATGLPLSRFGIRDGGQRNAAAQGNALGDSFALRHVEAKESAVGGPFLPPRETSMAELFENNLGAAERAMREAGDTRRVIRSLPLARPLHPQHEITSGYGTRLDPFTRSLALHSGIDFRAPTGTPVRATASGTVIEAGTNGGYGRMVEIDHGNGISTRYAHLSSIGVKEGDRVTKGGVIGHVGSTGRSTGPHLHYEVRIDEDAADPMRFLRAARGTP